MTSDIKGLDNSKNCTDKANIENNLDLKNDDNRISTESTMSGASKNDSNGNNLNSDTIKNENNDNLPRKTELNCDAPILPIEFERLINIRDFSNQRKIGNFESIDRNNDKDFSHVNSSYVKLSSPPHILL